MKVRQSDIAKALNISRTTVARALNGSGYVDEETKRKIFELSENLQYRKNLFASSLAAKNKLRVHCAYVRTYNKAFVQGLEAGFQAAVRQFGSYGIEYSFSSVSSETPREQLRALDALLDEKIDALIVMPLFVDEVRPLIKTVVDRGSPVITLNMDVPDSGRAAFVGSDNYSGGRIAAELYAKFLRGRGRILVFDSTYRYAMPEDRRRGFLDKIAEYPLISSAGPIHIGDLDEMYDRTREALAGGEPVDGIYTVTDIAYVVRAIDDLTASAGRRPDLRLVAMDDDESARTYLRDGRIDAIVGQQPFIQGYLALKLAAERLLSKDQAPAAAPRIEYDIVVKENLTVFDAADFFQAICRGM